MLTNSEGGFNVQHMMAPTNDIPERLAQLFLGRKADTDPSLPSPTERKLLRIRAGLTQSEMARVIGVHVETFGRWERGDGRPGRDAADAYIQALEILERKEA